MNEELYTKDPDKAWFLVGDETETRIVQGEVNAKMWGEGGRWTSRSGWFVSEEILRQQNGITDEPCRECGSIVSTNYSKDTKEILLRDNICFTCLHWRGYFNKKDNPCAVRVEGGHYWIERACGPPEHRGFGGRLFLIQFHDGRQVECSNLWHQGKIAPAWKERIPDNARFVREFVKPLPNPSPPGLCFGGHDPSPENKERWDLSPDETH